MKKLGGIYVPHRKNTANCIAKNITTPNEVVIPMSMHIGAPAKPIVSPGDHVRAGQLIGEAQGRVSAPVHCTISGTVKKFIEIRSAVGRVMSAAVIESDGKMEYCELKAPQVTSRAEFIQAIRDGGIVGCGGAGFPTAVKLDVEAPQVIDTVVIDGAECEPYITTDTRTMTDDIDLLVDGMRLIKKYISPERIVIGVERNKPECIGLLKNKLQSDGGIDVMTLPSRYPQGGEKVIVYETTGRIVPEGKFPIDVNVAVMNCSTVASIARYIRTGMPLIAKRITVDGSAIREPGNVIVPLGTKLCDVIGFCGGYKTEPKKVIYGGPMMGIASPDTSLPIVKTTNAVLAFDDKDSAVPDSSACIHCGRCVRHCPLRLMPTCIERAYTAKRTDELKHLNVSVCMECGCCAYVCPAKRPLVQINRLAKALVRESDKMTKI